MALPRPSTGFGAGELYRESGAWTALASGPSERGLVPPRALDPHLRASLVDLIARDPSAAWLARPVIEALIELFLFYMRALYESESSCEAGAGILPPPSALGCAPAIAAVWRAFASSFPDEYGRFCEAHFGRLVPTPTDGHAVGEVATTLAFVAGCAPLEAQLEEYLAIAGGGDDDMALALLLAGCGRDLFSSAVTTAPARTAADEETEGEEGEEVEI